MRCETCGRATRKLALFTSTVDHCDHCEKNEESQEVTEEIDISDWLSIPEDFSAGLAAAYYHNATCFTLGAKLHTVVAVMKGKQCYVDTETEGANGTLCWRFVWDCDNSEWRGKKL